MLPRKFSIPLFDPPEKVKYLKGTCVFNCVIKDLFNFARQFLHIRQLIQRNPDFPLTLEQFTLDAFKWARAITLTRQNPLPRVDGETTHYALCLIPFYDMFNHQPGHVSTMFDPVTQTAQVAAFRDFEPGSQVFITYGNRSNQDLYLFSGFVDKTFILYDGIRIPVSISSQDALAEKRIALLTQAGLPSCAMLELGYPPLLESSDRLITFIHVLTMNETELDNFKTKQSLVSLNAPVIQWLKLKVMVLLKGLQQQQSNVPKDERLILDIFHVEHMLLKAVQEELNAF